MGSCKLMKNEEPINWAELPHELTSSILFRLDVDEILLTAQRVCRSWRRVCKHQSMWQKVDMRRVQRFSDRELDSLCRHAVDLSQGDLQEIKISGFGSDGLLSYIANSSSNVRCLVFGMCLGTITDECLVKVLTKLPFLKTIEVTQPLGLKVNLKAIGQACPQLQTFKLRIADYLLSFELGSSIDDNDNAIAETMPELRHLQLLGNRLTDTGLNAILDNLPYLNYLDLRGCFNIKLVGNLEKRCLERVKELIRPEEAVDESSADFPTDLLYLDLEF